MNKKIIIGILVLMLSMSGCAVGEYLTCGGECEGKDYSLLEKEDNCKWVSPTEEVSDFRIIEANSDSDLYYYDSFEDFSDRYDNVTITKITRKFECIIKHNETLSEIGTCEEEVDSELVDVYSYDGGGKRVYNFNDFHIRVEFIGTRLDFYRQRRVCE